MSNKVYITKLRKFLPNKTVENSEMENHLGFIKGVKSKAKALILRNNGIKARYYAINSDGKHTHTNAEMVAEAIKKLCPEKENLQNIEVLAVGTSSPDQLLPAHASMVHGLLKNNPMEVITPEGSCNSGMLAFKYAYMSVVSGNSKNAIAGGSEKFSSWLRSQNFEDEASKLEELKQKPVIGFEKEFLRWMLSDGAGVALLENKPNKSGLSLEINWIDITSYANELPSCMYAGGERTESGQMKPWREFTPREIADNGLMSLRQDVKLLGDNIIKYGALGLKRVTEKYNFNTNEVTYFLPHMSSEYFRAQIEDEAEKIGCPIPQKKWFTNLSKFGNVGSASAYFMLEELFNSNKLKAGDKILIMSPESARFSYAYAMLTVIDN
ncbi:beta-ketoacyl-ACP synthase III [Ancylomarina sp. YFZ004]